MPPCQPANPVPAAIASRRPVSCSAVTVPIDQLCTIRSVPASRSASV